MNVMAFFCMTKRGYKVDLKVLPQAIIHYDKNG